MSESDSLETAKKAVDDLYYFRDHYFETHDLAKAINKPDDVEEQLKKCREILEPLQAQIKDKASYFMLLGKALNVQPGTHPEAQDFLAKSVKLNPRLGEAWVALGECYWTKNDIESAKNCFLGALNHSNDKVALRSLSMVLRQITGGSPEDRLKRIEESVDKAREAVKLDIKDGTSWLILGNAYLSLFFTKGQNPTILKQALSAYQQAERDAVTNCNPDLHFNRATLYKYQQEYELALFGYARACLLDPTWKEAQTLEKNLVSHLGRIQELVESRGKMKDKRLKALVESLGESDLGPYAGGSYQGPKGQSVDLAPVKMAELRPGVNENKVVCGKVVCSVQAEDDCASFTFCMVDQDVGCFAVSVYNIHPSWGVKIGDAVAIPEPVLHCVNVQYKEEVFNFKSLRVESPVILVINGRKQGMDAQAPATLAVSTLND